MLKHPHFRITKGPSNILYLIIVFLAGAIATLIVLFVYFNISNVLWIASVRSPLVININAVLSLQSAETDIRSGQNIGVSVNLDTRLPTTGIDVSLKYDPRYLELVEKKTESPSSPMRYLDTSLSVFDIFPYASLKKENGLKTLDFSALAKPLREFQGAGVVASLTFKTLQPGETDVSFVYEPGSSLDSNIAFNGKDILRNVVNLHMAIR